MKIADVLITENISVSFGDRWLVRLLDGMFVVFEKKYGKKNITRVVETMNEDTAVMFLLEHERKEKE
jgi:hypothetical protein